MLRFYCDVKRNRKAENSYAIAAIRAFNLFIQIKAKKPKGEYNESTKTFWRRENRSYKY